MEIYISYSRTRTYSSLFENRYHEREFTYSVKYHQKCDTQGVHLFVYWRGSLFIYIGQNTWQNFGMCGTF